MSISRYFIIFVVVFALSKCVFSLNTYPLKGSSNVIDMCERENVDYYYDEVGLNICVNG